MDTSEAKRPDIRTRSYWAGVGIVCAAFFALGEITQTPAGVPWAVRTGYNLGYAIAPVLFGGGMAFVVHKWSVRGGGPGFERQVAGMWWWTFWVAAFSFAAHLRALFR